MRKCIIERIGIFMTNHAWVGAFIFLLVVLTMCSGCGHSMLVMNKNVGLLLRVPVGEANYVGFGIGSTESTVAAVRGGTSFESTTSAGGGFFSGTGAQNNITCFRSNLQFNEGNLRDAFVSPDIPMEVKLKLAEGVVEGSKAPKFPDSIVTTRDATMQLGDKAVTSNAVAVAKLEPAGLDRVVDKTPAIVDSVTKPITSTVHDLVNPLEGTISSTTNVINSVTNVVNTTATEVHEIIDHAQTTVDDTLDNTKKTIVFILGVSGAAFCIFMIILCLTSLFRSKHPKHHKAVLQPCMDEDTPVPEKKQSESKEPEKEEERVPLNWWQTLRLIIMQIVLAIVGFIGWIPGPVKKKAGEALKKAWEQHKAQKK